MTKGLRKRKGKRLSDYVSSLPSFRNGPSGHVTVNESGNGYVLTTMLGARVAFDMCGRCGLNVKHCTCTRGPSLPRSAEYIWDQDNALSKSEEWDHSHPHYSGSFTTRETKKNQRITMPSLSDSNTAEVKAPYVKPTKRLADYVSPASKAHAEGVSRLLRGRKR